MARREPRKDIEEYREKRDFERTREPAPGAAPGSRGEGGAPPVFVVHRHDARRLHYDLRLEMEGVLRSWAVPKGFSFDPVDKHLAVRTEDHPIEYEHFDGIIPKGEYGAGSMTIWDRGWYEAVKETDPVAAVASGELKIVLHGRRLRGEWHMVKTKGGPNHWLLFKSKDRYAGPGRDSALGVELAPAELRDMPTRVEPVVAEGTREAFSDPRWLFEADFEGRRALLEKRGDEVRLRGLDCELPALAEDARAVGAENALLDGVLVATDAGGRPSRELLDARLAGDDQGPVHYYAFDLLYFDEFDLRPLPLLDRKAALRTVLPPVANLLFMDHVLGEGGGLAQAVAAAGLPGVVAKPADAPYGEGAGWTRVSVGPDGDAPAPDVATGLRAAQKQARSRVKLTNLGKVFWPAEGYTKGDLVAWYEAVAEVILPYLQERPVHMNRFPDGIEGKSFYQRRAKEDTPAWAETERIADEPDGGEPEEPTEYLICNERDTLLWLANQGSIDLHPWMSRRATPDSPDYAILDLDPKQAPFADVVRIARELGKLLTGIGIRPLLKTSGKTGLHICIPLEPGYTYDQARGFCEAVARVVARDLRDIATVERVVGEREGRVYVDYGQNARGQTVVPPYVVRPVRGATVSTPLEWDELTTDLTPAQFTLRTVLPRLEERGDLYRASLTDLQDLMPAIEQLQALLAGR